MNQYSWCIEVKLNIGVPYRQCLESRHSMKQYCTEAPVKILHVGFQDKIKYKRCWRVRVLSVFYSKRYTWYTILWRKEMCRSPVYINIVCSNTLTYKYYDASRVLNPCNVCREIRQCLEPIKCAKQFWEQKQSFAKRLNPIVGDREKR